MLVVENLENTKNYSEQNKTKITQGIITEEFILVFFFFFFFTEPSKAILSFSLYLAMLGLRCCSRALSSCGERGPLLIAVRRSMGSRHSGLSSCGTWWAQ